MSFLRDTSDNPRRDAELLRHDLGALDDTAASDAEARARLLGRIAERCRVLGEHEAAVAHASDAVREAGRVRHGSTLFASNVIRLATALQYSGRHAEAIDLLERVVLQVDRPGSERYLHYAWQHLGTCHVEVGDQDRARECFDRALEIRTRMGNQSLVESTRAALAML